jgi:hypothetical protein
VNIKVLKVQEEDIQKHCDAMYDRIDKDNELIYQKSFDLM